MESSNVKIFMDVSLYSCDSAIVLYRMQTAVEFIGNFSTTYFPVGKL